MNQNSIIDLYQILLKLQRRYGPARLYAELNRADDVLVVHIVVGSGVNERMVELGIDGGHIRSGRPIVIDDIESMFETATNESE